MAYMRSKLVLKNIIFSLLNQLVTIIVGLIIPRLFIKHYGSSINGLISSITQFLGYIVLLESGASGVIRAAFYKPLAHGEQDQLSAIVRASNSFFRKIGTVFLVYLLSVTVIYPLIVSSPLSYASTALLVLIIGISTLFQYYYGITNEVLLHADQKLWVSSSIQTVFLIAKAMVAFVLISLNCSVHLTRLFITLIYIIQPLFFHFYVSNSYGIKKNVEPDEKAIEQRWDGLGHHIASFVHRNIDIVLLSVFSSIVNVSIYSIYYAIVNGVRQIIQTMANAMAPALGNMLAKEESDTLNKTFTLYEMLNAILVTIFYTTTALTIIPFISIYLKGVQDANYAQPLFAIILIASEAFSSFRNPYLDVCLSAGHFRETKGSAYIEALINVVVSLLLVRKLGLIGVAIGTLMAVVFRTIYHIQYLKKKLIKRSVRYAYKTLFLSIGASLLSYYCASHLLRFNVTTVFQWIWLGGLSFMVTSAITIALFSLFSYRDSKILFHKIVQVISKEH